MSVDSSALPAGATVAQYLTKKWGIKTRLVPLSVVAVLTTPTRVVKNNPRRFALIVVNNGTGSVFVGWDNGVTISNGLPLSASGGSITLLADEDGELTCGEMIAIAAAGGNNLSVWEVESL